MEIILSIISVFLEQYRTRKMLKKVKIPSMGIEGSKKEGYKRLLDAHARTKQQLVLRQIYGALGGSMCNVMWEEDGEIVVFEVVRK